MLILHTINEAREYISNARREGKKIGLVPTMGYFHEGHLSLMRRARVENDVVVVSLFVNPAQFGPNEDFARYPRDVDRDARLAEEVGVDVIFNPSVEEMYPEGYATFVNVEGITETLEGEFRPGHFRGVATVVLKLFNILPADRAYFGLKDYQQLLVVKKMVNDLNLPIEIVPMPIIREEDGLAMSSRNTYLNNEERRAAVVLYKALQYANELVKYGLTDGKRLEHEVEEYIRKEPLARIDYVAVRDPDNLAPVVEISKPVVLLLAVRIGSTRLIDNAVLPMD
ncbi:MAG: pantoate--beta-alanine ligase [Armatimonadetes bacterium]|nr:pantoate--beta-alanine ligase [Armatimonadota bacterium]